MKPNSHEQSKRHTFDSFCKKVLKHEARDYYDELKRQRDREVSFSDLSEKELAQLYTEDKYFVSEQIFNVLGLNVIVTDDVIAEALQSLPERKRDIILLSYFLELSDREIGDKLNMLRSTVQYQRTSTLQQLKNFMKGDIQSKTQGYINEQARPCVFFVFMLRSRHSKRHEHTGENEPTKRKKKGAYTSQTVLRILTR